MHVFSRSLQKAKSEQKTEGQRAHVAYITSLGLFVNESHRHCKKRSNQTTGRHFPVMAEPALIASHDKSIL